MIKKFTDFFKKNSKDENVYTQDELDDRLLYSIEINNYKIFVDSINKGANVNVSKFSYGRRYTPLINCIFAWRHDDNKSRAKFSKTLIDNDVDLFDTVVEGPHGLYKFDVIESIEKLVGIEDHNIKKEIIDYIINKLHKAHKS